MIVTNFEGCDGIGKSTEANRLVESLRRQGINAKVIHFDSNNLMRKSVLEQLHHDKSTYYVLDRGYLSNLVYSFVLNSKMRPLSISDDGTFVEMSLWRMMTFEDLKFLTDLLESPMKILVAENNDIIYERLKLKNELQDYSNAVKANIMYKHIGAALIELGLNVEIIKVK